MDKKRKSEREVYLVYSFDRLSANKIVQAYRLLVPERVWATGYASEYVEEKGEVTGDEVGSDLCASVIGSAEGRKNNW